MSPQDVLAMCRERGVKAVDLRFMDFPGLWQHFTTPVDKLVEDLVTEPVGLRDGVLTAPDGPGLGVEVDEGVVAKYTQWRSERKA